MKNIKTFEGWENNIIDDTLFSSGKAKYDPHVVGGIIKYKTGSIEPYFFAKIVEKGGVFYCKIYKKIKNGETIRLRNKKKDDLKTAHNYVREFLNQKLKQEEKKENKKKKKSKILDNNKKNDFDRDERDDSLDTMNHNLRFDSTDTPISFEPPKKKTIIRRF